MQFRERFQTASVELVIPTTRWSAPECEARALAACALYTHWREQVVLIVVAPFIQECTGHLRIRFTLRMDRIACNFTSVASLQMIAEYKHPWRQIDVHWSDRINKLTVRRHARGACDAGRKLTPAVRSCFHICLQGTGISASRMFDDNTRGTSLQRPLAEGRKAPRIEAAIRQASVSCQ